MDSGEKAQRKHDAYVSPLGESGETLYYRTLKGVEKSTSLVSFRPKAMSGMLAVSLQEKEQTADCYQKFRL